MTKIRLGNKDIYYQVFYKNIKNMYLRVKGDRLVITANKVSKEKIEAFILKNEHKILKTLNQIESKVPLYNEETLDIFGKKYQIVFTLDNKKNKYNITENTIYIDFKTNHFDIRFIENIYKKLLLNEMINFMNDDIVLSQYFDLTDVNLKTQLMKSRYGSCIPSKRVIKLNSILARFDVAYIKTILIHEIIHLKVHNHQAEFYKYINLLIPNYKEIIKSLNALTRKYVI